jgi:sigma-E factor negative regulatory protein RseA
VASRRQRWLAPAAVAAGFVAVAGVLVVTRLAVPEGAGGAPTLARTGPAAGGPGLTLVTGSSPAAATAVPGAPMLRDPRLDAYINAHQAARGGGAAAVPGAALRSVEVVVSPASAVPAR